MDSYGHFNLYWKYLPEQEKIYRKYFGEAAPPLLDVLTNTPLLFTNDHFSLTFPRPLGTNVIPLGGIHVQPVKPLPKVRKNAPGYTIIKGINFRLFKNYHIGLAYNTKHDLIF